MTELRKGRAKSVKIETAQKIANYLEVPVDYLLTGEVPNGFSLSDNENPYVIEIADTVENLGVDDQIYIANWVSQYAKNPTDQKNSPDELVLTEGEKDFILLLRQIPEDRQKVISDMVRAYSDNLNKG